MDNVRCEKYKIFQPELPTKKFPPDEDLSIHNIKVLRGDSGDQNKSTYFEGEGEEEKPVTDLEVIEEEPPEEMEQMTPYGLFRDGKRRIDIVLVIKDDVNKVINKVQLDFIVYILRAGLEIEIEPGVLKKHRNLTFIKIHAPESLIEKYGVYFGTKRNFADTRYEYMDRTSRNKRSKEKQCVKLMRSKYNKPKGYSNYERSIIVYKILLHLPFSDHEDDYGVERLIHKYVIADIYALHDGPYKLTSEQTISDLNGRQIVNDFWIKNHNICKKQPIHLIQEYFGPTVAFYFSFYEYFNKALQLASIASICVTVYGMGNLKSYEEPIKKGICTSDEKICQTCNNNVTCPARNCKEYCLSAKIHLFLDHKLVTMYSIFLIIGAFMFIRVWKRKEKYLKWMWEVGRSDSYYKKAVLPMYDSGLGAKADLFSTPKKIFKTLIPVIFRNFVSKVIIILYWYCLVPVMVNTYVLYQKFGTFVIKNKLYTEKKKYGEYVILSLFYTFYIMFCTIFEKMYSYFANFVVKYENFNSYEKHWESLIIKKFGFKMVKQYIFIAYFAWIHGHYLYYGRSYLTSYVDRFPLVNVHNMLKSLYGYDADYLYNPLSFCFPYSCIIEVATLVATLILVTEVIYKIVQCIIDTTSDATNFVNSRSDVPFWEKDYMLSSICHEEMFMKYVNLASEFAMVLWFVIAFPLAPIVLYLINIWDVRNEARKFLHLTRRPLLLKTPAIGWSKVFYFIAFFSVVTNVINIVLLTRTPMRYIMTKYKRKNDKLFDYVTHTYKNNGFNCKAPDMRTTRKLYYRQNPPEPLIIVDYILLIIYRYYFFLLFVGGVSCAIFIIFLLFPKPRQVKIAREIEQKIRKLYKHYEYKNVH